MSAMLTIIVALGVGIGSGTVTGGALGFWLAHRPHPRPAPLDDLALDPDLDRQIDHAAQQWAEANQRPGAAPLVADKLRLAHRLNQRRQRRRWSQ